MRILIVDDEADSAESLGSTLELYEFKVDLAPTAAVAEQMCLENEYGLVFLDLGLPDRDGLELLPMFRTRCPDADIFILTGNTSLDAAVRAVNDGASLYLLKPINPSAVVTIVKRANDDRERRQQIKFQSLVLDNVQESVAAVDLDGNVIYWNHGAEALYGWSQAEMMGQPIRLMFPPGQHDQADLSRDLPGDGTPRVQETQRTCKDGHVVEVEERTHTLRDPAGKHIGYLALSRDIAERKTAERKIENALQLEHQNAVRLQQALLPKELPQHRPGLEIGRRYAPAWSEADVGGDFYDVLPLSGGRTAVVLGDVSGKGLDAGILMGRIRHVLNAYADEDDRPRHVLERTNRHLVSKMPEERFVTLFFATYDPTNQCLRYASAGHEPAILRRSDGSIELLNDTGPMVGVDVSLGFGCELTHFRPGDLLLIYTDGASEAGGPNHFLGTEGLVELIRKFAHLPVERLLDELQDAIVAQYSGHAQDDLALLCLRAEVWTGDDA